MLQYRKAALPDLELLVRTRLQVLRAANGLPQNTPLPEVEKESLDYYRQALQDGSHTAYLVFDDDQWVGTGGISYYRVMPTCAVPDGRKAYIMNMYTAPDHRRRGIARETLRLLIRDAAERGVTAVSLEATAAGRPLYEAFGFLKMEHEMEYPKGGIAP